MIRFALDERGEHCGVAQKTAKTAKRGQQAATALLRFAGLVQRVSGGEVTERLREISVLQGLEPLLVQLARLTEVTLGLIAMAAMIVMTVAITMTVEIGSDVHRYLLMS
jgi:hypothetical protein